MAGFFSRSIRLIDENFQMKLLSSFRDGIHA